MKKNLQTETWSSHLAFYLSVAGAAIGLGTLWRFPFLVGQYGGGLFVLVFAVVCVFIATPLLIAEFMIGRRGGMNVPLAPARVALAAGRSRNWAAIGWLGTLAIFLIMTYYSVIGGWVLAYVKAFGLDGAASLDRAALAARFDALLANPWRLAFWHAAFMAATIAISAPGLHRGIELGNKIMLPGLFLILFGLGLYALVQGDASRGLAYLTHVDFGDLSAELVLAAVGQAFYATGVGMAIMIAYGSHVTSDESLPRSAAVVVGSIILASLLASCLIFPLAFAYGEDPAQGPQLAFIVLPSMFVGMPGAPVVGTCFFLLLAFASLSSSIAGLEPGAGWLMERHGMSRASAVTLVGASAWVLGLGTVWSFNLWKDVHPLGRFPHFHEHTPFALVDYFSANLLLPIGALLTCIFVGWRLHSTPVDTEFGKDRRLRGTLLLLLRYVCPLAILGVLITAL